ncbi:MAG: hypothetical protein RRY99_17060, partial [Flavobacterium sp.]
METLKQVLEADQAKKTKNELIDLLSGVEKLLSPSVYEKISGVEPSELSNLSKKEILDIVDSFKKNYDAKWENSVAAASSEVMKMIFNKMAADDEIFKTSA